MSIIETCSSLTQNKKSIHGKNSVEKLKRLLLQKAEIKNADYKLTFNWNGASKDDSNVAGEEVFVVESYNEDYKSEKMSTLLVNKELKNKYDEIHKKIDKAKDELLKKIKPLSGLTRYTSIEEEISKSFSGKKFFDAMEEMETEIFKEEEPKFASIIYDSIFNRKALNVLNTKDFKNQIKEYIEKYNKLLDKSKYLKKGFEHYKASAVQKNLKENAFFKAQHSVNLHNKVSNKEFVIKKDGDFKNIIQGEKNNILSNKDLSKKWEEIDNQLNANKDSRKLRDYLLENKEILPELGNLKKFAREIWISYFINQKDLYKKLLREYKNGKVEIGKIVIEAKKQKTDWKEVVNIFNRRFSSPFELKIENQDDVLLKGSVPVVRFIFKDKESGKNIQVEKDKLQKVLSSGEKRALYILNIIFEVQARKKSNQETLFIVDDIAESFDYKNKYAIIQYLKEISEEPIFYQIILTHNFDFFRTLEGRKVVSYPNCFFSYRTESEIKLEKATGIRNIFIKDWKNNLTDSKKLIASIPFVRNLIEYTKGEDNEDYKKLTSLLHWKSNSENLLIRNLREIFRKTIVNINFPEDNLEDKVTDKIFEEAKNCLAASEGINFENKIVLSIAIRLKAEKFMIDKINDSIFVSSIDRSQTYKLFKKYKKNNLTEIENLKILEEVNLMTPGNIHLNSFMYEPILDMSDQHLKDLYNRLKKLK